MNGWLKGHWWNKQFFSWQYSIYLLFNFFFPYNWSTIFKLVLQSKDFANLKKCNPVGKSNKNLLNPWTDHVNFSGAPPLKRNDHSTSKLVFDVLFLTPKYYNIKSRWLFSNASIPHYNAYLSLGFDLMMTLITYMKVIFPFV